MRTSEERVNEMHRRIETLKRKNARRAELAREAGMGALCLGAAVGIALAAAAAPKFTAAAGEETLTGSIFASRPALGYIAVALAAFCLGGLFTMVCFRLRSRKEEKTDDRDR